MTIREDGIPDEREVVLRECERIGLPFAPINRPEDMFDDPHLNHPGAMLDLTLPDGRQTRIPTLPLEVDGARSRMRRPVPKAGEHSREICQEIGLDDAEIDALFAEGRLTGPPAAL